MEYCGDHGKFAQDMGELKGLVSSLLKEQATNRETLNDIYEKLNSIERRFSRWEGKAVGAGALAGAIIGIVLRFL